MSGNFQLNAALATTDVNESIAKGQIDLGGFLEEFRGFDWGRESKQAVWANKSSPGLAVTNQANDSMLWVHAYHCASENWPGLDFPDEFTLTFVVGLYNPFSAPTVYSISNQKDMAECAFVVRDKVSVEKLFTLFFIDAYDDLYQMLFNMEIATMGD